MKIEGTTLWARPNQDATNSSGFTGLPGGSRDNDGTFLFTTGNGYWWSSSEDNSAYILIRILDSGSGNAPREISDKISGRSVRCVKD